MMSTLAIIFGIAAIVFAILNLIFLIKNKDSKLFRFLSISCTAIVPALFYVEAAQYVVKKDIAALEDVVVTIANIVLGLVIASIVINSISLLKK